MAGDWIKMRGNLWDDPRVARLCDITDQTEGPVIGGLYWLWATADQHTEDGLMPGLTLRQIDRKTGLTGFGAALCQVGWLEEVDGGVRIARFEEHNGSSAKRRSSDAQRKASVRNVSASDADNTRTDGGQAADEMRGSAELEKEKRREEEKNSPPPSVVAPSPRGLRKCPASFVVTPELQAWAESKFPAIDWRAETEAFRDYTFSKAIVDWDGAWRNWIRKSRPAQGNRGSPIVETSYARTMRQKYEQVAPGVAAKAPDAPRNTPFEVVDVEARPTTPLLG